MGPFRLFFSQSTGVPLLALIAAQWTSQQVFAFHRAECSFCFLTIGHFNKPKTPAAARFPVMDDFRALNMPMGFKRFPQDHVVDAPSEISYKNVHDSLKLSGTKVGELIQFRCCVAQFFPSPSRFKNGASGMEHKVQTESQLGNKKNTFKKLKSVEQNG
jgi:hypothetical protein